MRHALVSNSVLHGSKESIGMYGAPRVIYLLDARAVDTTWEELPVLQGDGYPVTPKLPKHPKLGISDSIRLPVAGGETQFSELR